MHSAEESLVGKYVVSLKFQNQANNFVMTSRSFMKWVKRCKELSNVLVLMKYLWFDKDFVGKANSFLKRSRKCKEIIIKDFAVFVKSS